MQKQRLRQESASGVDPILAAVLVLLGFVILSAWMIWTASAQARAGLESKDAMVYLITGNGIQTDDKATEANLAAATQGLFAARRVALVLFVGSGLVLASLLVRPVLQSLSRPESRTGPRGGPHDKPTPRRVDPARPGRRGTVNN